MLIYTETVIADTASAAWFDFDFFGGGSLENSLFDIWLIGLVAAPMSAE